MRSRSASSHRPTRRDIELPEAFRDLFRPARYKAFYGGRGSGKSHAMATALVLLAAQKPLRILAARQYQRSIRDSSKRLIDDRIAALGLGGRFKSTETDIQVHYANLCVAAGGVDSFIIGSELVGLTRVRTGPGGASYPAVQQLKALAAVVKGIVGPGCRVGYAADWSEYHSHRPADGTGDVIFNMDPLWSDPHIDFIGIDNYLPMSDWRDGSPNVDSDPVAGPFTIYNKSYLARNVEGGEDYEWYYASPADRVAQRRTPIVDTAYGEHWVFRQKDIRSWWSNPHVSRPGGVREGAPTSYVPQAKPIWFTEFGCPAVDKGPNQPNVFYDPKSSESSLPYFSRGNKDDPVQRAYLETMLSYWRDQGVVSSNGYLDITAPGARSKEILPGDIVQMGFAGPVWQVPFTAQLYNLNINTIRIGSLGTGLLPVISGGPITIYRHRFEWDATVQSYAQQANAYPYARRFYCPAAGSGYLRLYPLAQNGRDPANMLLNPTTDVVVPPGGFGAITGYTTLPFSPAGTWQVSLPGTDFSALAGKYIWVFSTFPARDQMENVFDPIRLDITGAIAATYFRKLCTRGGKINKVMYTQGTAGTSNLTITLKANGTQVVSFLVTAGHTTIQTTTWASGASFWTYPGWVLEWSLSGGTGAADIAIALDIANS